MPSRLCARIRLIAVLLLMLGTPCHAASGGAGADAEVGSLSMQDVVAELVLVARGQVRVGSLLAMLGIPGSEWPADGHEGRWRSSAPVVVDDAHILGVELWVDGSAVDDARLVLSLSTEPCVLPVSLATRLGITHFVGHSDQGPINAAPVRSWRRFFANSASLTIGARHDSPDCATFVFLSPPAGSPEEAVFSSIDDVTAQVLRVAEGNEPMTSLLAMLGFPEAHWPDDGDEEDWLRPGPLLADGVDVAAVDVRVRERHLDESFLSIRLAAEPCVPLARLADRFELTNFAGQPATDPLSGVSVRSWQRGLSNASSVFAGATQFAPDCATSIVIHPPRRERPRSAR